MDGWKGIDEGEEESIRRLEKGEAHVEKALGWTMGGRERLWLWRESSLQKK